MKIGYDWVWGFSGEEVDRSMTKIQHTPDYPSKIYFYKVDAPYGCFSNFSPHSIELSGKSWATVEHYYQAHKFLGTQLEYLMIEIAQASSPELAAQIGRNPVYQPRLDWDLRKCTVMYEAVLQKFTTHLDLQQTLIDTFDREIIEDSPVDYFWGCGVDRTGFNHLGQIIMQVRSTLVSYSIL